MDYTATITTTASPLTAAQAIDRDLELWWSTRVDRHANGFTVRFNNSHARFERDAGSNDLAFGWTCTDAHMIIEDVPDASEWAGTQLLWSVTPTESGSTVSLTHRGLTPQIACFDVCQRGWQHFFESSLRNHLNGQVAQPEASQPVT